MTPKLGKVEKPEANTFQNKRKLLLVPLIHKFPNQPEEGELLLQKYWVQMQSQVESLEAQIGAISHIYHESLTEKDDAGLSKLKSIDERSYKFAISKRANQASIEATENEDILLEFIDLQRCLMIPLISDKVPGMLQEMFLENLKNRYAYISNRINESLGNDEVGILLINERHQVQFPTDVEVFYVSPPALDEYRRWLQNWIVANQNQSSQGTENGNSDQSNSKDVKET
tara:strand:+ start:6740 stop:7426 length:687 start_codon:yes stop_codon:yes gene_type:complete